MNLYIRIQDGQPFEHPLFEDNVKQVWPDIDLNNLPSNLARFERVNPPNSTDLGLYKVYVGVSYELIDGVWKDVHQTRQMTDEEKQIKDQEIRNNVENLRSNNITWAQDKLSICKDAEKQYWEQYIETLKTFEPPNLSIPRFPMPPRFDTEGNLLTLDNSGSTPTVIG